MAIAGPHPLPAPGNKARSLRGIVRGSMPPLEHTLFVRTVMMEPRQTSSDAPRAAARAWVAPSVQDMPALVDLTLQTGLVMNETKSRRGFRV
jgi:hypothetical protein